LLKHTASAAVKITTAFFILTSAAEAMQLFVLQLEVTVILNVLKAGVF
jgi:hypothetical protein